MTGKIRPSIMINEEALKAYLKKEFTDIIQVDIRKLGSGVQGSGFLIEMKTLDSIRSYVVKTLLSEGLGHDYPSDRAAVFLLDLDEYKNLPRHVKAIDVLSEMEDGSIKSIGGGREYYLLMERGTGRHYFNDLIEFSHRDKLKISDIEKIEAMTSYLAEIHSIKKDSKTLYWRKLRDTVGHGECLMGVFDSYPDGTLQYNEMAEIIKKSVDWIARLKPKFKRLSQIHGDFHPGNIWFKEVSPPPTHPSPSRGEGKGGGETSELRTKIDFVLLDRSRGPWGDPADDVTALTINYIFFSIKHYGTVRGSYLEGLRLFFERYVTLTGDDELFSVVAPFYAFRGAVVANPVFYPELTPDQRRLIFRFVNNVLDDKRFRLEKVNDYLG
ncbi:MAG: aminoglycoside phosphotransferase family protein [Nitrospirota bacterium]